MSETTITSHQHITDNEFLHIAILFKINRVNSYTYDDLDLGNKSKAEELFMDGIL